MKISQLIEQLERCKDINGDLECVMEMRDFFDKTRLSTVETLYVKKFDGENKEVLIDWRC